MFLMNIPSVIRYALRFVFYSFATWVGEIFETLVSSCVPSSCVSRTKRHVFYSSCRPPEDKQRRPTRPRGHRITRKRASEFFDPTLTAVCSDGRLLDAKSDTFVPLMCTFLHAVPVVVVVVVAVVRRRQRRGRRFSRAKHLCARRAFSAGPDGGDFVKYYVLYFDDTLPPVHRSNRRRPDKCMSSFSRDYTTVIHTNRYTGHGNA